MQLAFDHRNGNDGSVWAVRYRKKFLVGSVRFEMENTVSKAWSLIFTIGCCCECINKYIKLFTNWNGPSYRVPEISKGVPKDIHIFGFSVGIGVDTLSSPIDLCRLNMYIFVVLCCSEFGKYLYRWIQR